jgi:mono/diheme cytochrome c family protein
VNRLFVLPLAALALGVGMGAGIVAVSARPVTYELPEETAAFMPGPNLEVVQGNCAACHSADYIATQPRGLKNAFWEVEVGKMINVFGAPIDKADVPKIVDYLVHTY